MIEIDGSMGEGGGQIIRTALSLCAVTGKPIHITNIRANRPNPGLAPQHLTAARALRSICRGTLSHCEVGSTEFTFEPGEIVGGRYEFDIGTAGSTVLVAQTLLPILLSASKPSTVRIKGGTHVMKSPSYDYFEKVFLPAVSLFGAAANSRILHPGYYPKGGGEIELEVKPSQLAGNRTWLREEHVEVIIRLSGLEPGIAIREKKVFVQNKIEHVHVYKDEGGPGNAILAWSGFLGACVLGEKGKRAEQVAQECLDALGKEKAAASEVDVHLADQLLLYAALAGGASGFKTSGITRHTETNAYVISKLVERKIRIGTGEISVE
ncbi:RNA 3'-terminal phosphate cyclase [uncultured archaeon]|nr:RNA 3'-terminal phosphate cyclase [uncultured archaeon]